MYIDDNEQHTLTIGFGTIDSQVVEDVVEDFRRSKLRTDLRALAPVNEAGNAGSALSFLGEKSLGVGARKADLSTGFGAPCFALGVMGSSMGDGHGG